MNFYRLDTSGARFKQVFTVGGSFRQKPRKTALSGRGFEQKAPPIAKTC